MYFELLMSFKCSMANSIIITIDYYNGCKCKYQVISGNMSAWPNGIGSVWKAMVLRPSRKAIRTKLIP